VEDFYFYIADKRVIRRHGLDDLYSRGLDKNKIDKILLGVDSKDIISLFKSASSAQQKMIVQLVIDKLLAGESLDLNFVDRIQRASGIDIQQSVKDTQSLNEILANKEV
jgi:hypothetical protein